MVSNKQKRHQGGWHGGGLWQRRQRPPLWITTTQWTSRVGWWPYGKLNIFLEFFSSLQSSDLVHPTKQQIPAQKSEGYFESEFSSPQSICKLIEKFHAHKKYVYFGRESQTLEKKNDWLHLQKNLFWKLSLSISQNFCHSDFWLWTLDFDSYNIW